MTNNYTKNFFLRGLAFSGFGPIIAGIIYLILNYTIEGINLDGLQVFTTIISTYILAFVHAGASVFNQIDHWPVAKSLLCHFGLLYVAYVLCYLVNSWIPFEPTVILIFTVIFAVGYFAVWLIVFACIKATGRKLNKKLS